MPDFSHYKTEQDIQADFCDVLLLLAKNFHGQKVVKLQQEAPWLKEFRTSRAGGPHESDFEEAQAAFSSDGSAFLRTLIQFVELHHQELVGIFLLEEYRAYVFLVGDIRDMLEQRHKHRYYPGVDRTETKTLVGSQRGKLESQLWPRNGLEGVRTDKLHDDNPVSSKMERRLGCLKIAAGLAMFREDDDWSLGRPSIREIRRICKSFWQFCTQDWEREGITKGYKTAKFSGFFNAVHIAWATRHDNTRPPYAEETKGMTSVGIWWLKFRTSLHRFVSLVAVEKASFSVDENLQTLRNIHERRMQYVAMMQQTIQDLNKIVEEQHQVITALKFRYLLERLPGPAYADIGKLSERWKAFWGDVSRYYKNKTITASQGSAGDTQVEDGELGSEDNGTPSDKNVATAAEEPPAKEGGPKVHSRLDDLFNGRLSARMDSKGLELYSDLSEVIHRYKGDRYEVSETHFGPITADVMRALTPICITDGNIQWSEELLRYSQFTRNGEAAQDWKGTKGGESHGAPAKKAKMKRKGNPALESIFGRLKRLESYVEETTLWF